VTRPYPYPSILTHLDKYPPHLLDRTSVRTARDMLNRWLTDAKQVLADSAHHAEATRLLKEIYDQPIAEVEAMLARIEKVLGP
jgi:hypothetical protein